MIKKTLTYDYDTMLEAGRLLNQLAVSGTANFRVLARIADILDSGTVGEIKEPDKKAPERKAPERKGEKGDVLDKQAIHED